MAKAILPNGLPVIHRFITTHNKDGQAVFSDRQEEQMQWEPIGLVAKSTLGYTTSQYPVDFKDDKDISDYEGYLENKPGIVVPGGTVLRYVDLEPGQVSPMHRTVSLDYGVVLEGEVELILDSGETRLMRRGDVTIQRGTIHAWKNASSTEWCRMMYVLQESKPFTVAGNTLGEDYGQGMDDVRASAPATNGTH